MMRGGEEINRFRASRVDPSGLCRAEPFGNSFEDSVSFRFPSRQRLGGFPAPPVKCAPDHPPPTFPISQFKILVSDHISPVDFFRRWAYAFERFQGQEKW